MGYAISPETPDMAGAHPVLELEQIAHQKLLRHTRTWNTFSGK
jgi:hypothetical protein